MELLALAISQLTYSIIIVAGLTLVVWLITKTVRKPRPISGEQYVYSKPSDDDFFDAITEYRNDIPGK